MTEKVRILCVGADLERLDTSLESQFGDLPREDWEFDVLETDSVDQGILRRIDDLSGVDCIVSDHDPPRIDSLELLENVREKHSDLPFIIFTSRGDEKLASKAISAGATDYFRKEDEISRVFESIYKSVFGSEYEEEKPVSVYGTDGNNPTNRDDEENQNDQEPGRDETDVSGTPRKVGGEERSLRTIIENIPVVLFTIDDSGIFRRSEGKGLEKLGLSPGEVVGRSVYDVYSGYPEIIENIEKALDGEEINSTVEVGGTVFDYWCQPVFNTDDEVENIIGVAIDVTERETIQKKLRMERDRFVTLFENIPLPVVHGKADKEEKEPIIHTVNPAFEEVFDFEDDELEGKKLDEIIVPPDKETEAEELNTRIAEQNQLREEVTRRTEDGLRDFVLHINTHETEDGAIEGYAIYTDITERKRREKELERQKERLEDFASIVSHDLRTPLTTAQGYVELARENEDFEYLEKVDDSLSRMGSIIEDVLALARKGERVVDKEELEFERVVGQAWKNIKTEHATLVKEFEDSDGDDKSEPRTIRADKGRLLEILENLFQNSVTHNEGEVRIRVGLLSSETTTDSNYPNGFYVEDDGSGIPKDEREIVVERGYTSSEEGTGFGLAIVDTIVEAHGWELSVEESDMGGVRIEIEF